MLRNSQNISAFDIIGPNMVGPSSSHTAGALRISYLAQSLLEGPLREARFTLYGSFARTYRGHGTDRALLAGALGMRTDDLRIRDSFALAEAAGIRYTFEQDFKTNPPHPNTVDIELRSDRGEVLSIRGCSIGGGRALITRIQEVEVELSGAYDTLVIVHEDRPGVLASMVTQLSLSGINIAFLKLYRQSKGRHAFAVIETDEAIPQVALHTLRNHEAIVRCIKIKRTEI